MTDQDTTTSSGMLVPIQGLTALQIFAPGAVDPLLDKIKIEVRSVETDISTPAGRKAIASLAHKVARSKTFLDDMGKDLVSEWKQRSSAVDAERRRIRDELDDLKAEVRKPLDDFEAAEERRLTAYREALAAIENSAVFIGTPSAAEIRVVLSALEDTPDGRDWQEFSKLAFDARQRTIFALKSLLTTTEKAEADAAELARHRAEEAERAKAAAEEAQRKREEQIAAEAAENARLTAEKIAQYAAEAEARRVEEERLAEQRKVEAERVAAQKREADLAEAAALQAKIAEREKKEAADKLAKAEADRIAAEAKAKKDAEEAEARAKQAEIDAKQRQKEAEEAAAKRERDRIEAEKKAEEAATAKREANKAHRARINGAALAALVTAGLTEDVAKIAITAIIKGEIPNIAISY